MTSRRTFLHIGGVSGWALLISPLSTAVAQSQDQTSHAGHVSQPEDSKAGLPAPVAQAAETFTTPLNCFIE